MANGSPLTEEVEFELSPERHRPPRRQPARKLPEGEPFFTRETHQIRPKESFVSRLQNGFQPLSRQPTQQDGTSIATAQAYEDREAEKAKATAAAPRQDHRSTSAPVSNGLRTAARPWAVTVLLHTIPRYIKSAINFLADWKLVLFFFLLSVTPLLHGLYNTSGSWTSTRARMARGARLMVGMEEYERAPSRYEQAWQYFKYQYMLTEDDFAEWNMPELQWAYNLQFLTRIQKLEARTTALEETVADLTDKVRNDLPKMTVVQVEDGEFVVPEGFWLALHGKMTGDGSLWTAFLQANEDKLSEYTEKLVSDQLALGEKKSSVVGRVMLEDIIKDNYNKFLSDFRRSMDDERSDLVTQVRDVASQVAADLIARHTTGQLPAGQQAANRAAADHLMNQVDELTSINFFSPANGADIVMSLTSPTAIYGWTADISTWYAAYKQQPNKPITALKAWSEAGDSWCAAKSLPIAGKAQIAILTGRPVTPHELVVENAPRDGTLDIASAPRHVELWMDVGTEETVKQVQKAIEVENNSWQELECSQQPAPGFICAAQGAYDIHDDNWIQSMPVLDVFAKYKVKSDRYIVRATNNWGGDHTCFYRLRLKGQA